MKLIYNIVADWMYVPLIFVLILWWMQRFYRKFKPLYYCSIFSLIFVYVYSFVFWGNYPVWICGKISYFAYLAAHHFFVIFFIDPYESGDHPRDAFFAIRYLFETIIYTVILVGIFAVVRYLWEIAFKLKIKPESLEKAKKQKLQRFLGIIRLWFKLLLVPILLIATPFILGRYYFHAEEWQAKKLLKELVISAQNQTDFYKERLPEKDVKFLEDHLNDIKDNFKVKVYKSGPGQQCHCRVIFDNSFELSVSIIKKEGILRVTGFGGAYF